MTVIKLSGGDFVNDTMLVRCNLSEASSPVEINHEDGEGWRGTQFQCAHTRHSITGLIEIGKRIGAWACEMPEEDFDCDAEEV